MTRGARRRTPRRARPAGNLRRRNTGKGRPHPAATATARRSSRMAGAVLWRRAAGVKWHTRRCLCCSRNHAGQCRLNPATSHDDLDRCSELRGVVGLVRVKCILEIRKRSMHHRWATALVMCVVSSWMPSAPLLSSAAPCTTRTTNLLSSCMHHAARDRPGPTPCDRWSHSRTLSRPASARAAISREPLKTSLLQDYAASRRYHMLRGVTRTQAIHRIFSAVRARGPVFSGRKNMSAQSRGALIVFEASCFDGLP